MTNYEHTQHIAPSTDNGLRHIDQMLKVAIAVNQLPEDRFIGEFYFPYFAIPVAGDFVRLKGEIVYRCVSRQIDANELDCASEIRIWIEEVE